MPAPPAAGNAPAPPVPDPPTPWIVHEDLEPWPRAVANGTWPTVYPQYPEGPQRTVSHDHARCDRQIDAGVRAHLEMYRHRTGQDFLVGWDNIVQDGARKWSPDLVVYRQRPAAFVRGVTQLFDVRVMGVPDLVIEILSRGTWPTDVGAAGVPDDESKMWHYARIGIPEYWIANPHPADIPHPRLQGFALNQVRGGYEPLRPDGNDRWYSPVLATHWGVDAEVRVRLWDPHCHTWYPIENMSVALHAAQDAAMKAQRILAQQQQILDLQRWILDQQQPARDQVWATAVRYGGFTPDQRDRYREALAQLDPDQLPDALTLVPLLMECESARDWHAAVQLWLDTALDGTSDL